MVSLSSDWLLNFHKDMSTLFFPFSLPLVQLSKNMDSPFTINRENLSSCFSFCCSYWGAQSQNWSSLWAVPMSLWQPFWVPALPLAPSSFPMMVFPSHPFTEKFYCPVYISVNLLTHFCLEEGKVEIIKQQIRIYIVVRQICIE